MTTYISMLRGINVSGKKLIKMNALRMMYENLSFLNVRSAVYLYLPNGYGGTKLTNSLFENKLKVMATTRNWKTTKELLKLATQ